MNKTSYGPWMMFLFCKQCMTQVNGAAASCINCGGGRPFVEAPARRVYHEPGFLAKLFGKATVQVTVQLKPTK
jgi:hypothetical protein